MNQATQFRATAPLLYHYWGVSFGKLTRRVKVISANVVEGHAAVWAGVNAGDNVSWVQGGILKFPGEFQPDSSKPPIKDPMAYIERKQYGQSPKIETWPLPVGATVTVKLIKTSYKHWKCVIAWGNEQHESDITYIPRGLTIDACLEIWGHASASVMIGNKIINGSASH